MFYDLILIIIHKLIDIYVYLRLVIRDVFIIVLHLLNFVASFVPLVSSAKVCRFKKLPSHLSIIISEDEVVLSDVSNLIIWCIFLGIHHISIFDINGVVKANEVLLWKHIKLRKEQCLRKQSSTCNLIFKNSNLKDEQISHGHKKENFYIYLLSHKDGKSNIVKAAQTLCTEVIEKPSILKTFSAKHFDNYIRDVIDIPEPDLILLFGTTSGLAGYLPWHVRVSEILSYPSHRNILQYEFQNALIEYGNCEQRCGK